MKIEIQTNLLASQANQGLPTLEQKKFMIELFPFLKSSTIRLHHDLQGDKGLLSDFLTFENDLEISKNAKAFGFSDYIENQESKLCLQPFEMEVTNGKVLKSFLVFNSQGEIICQPSKRFSWSKSLQYFVNPRSLTYQVIIEDEQEHIFDFCDQIF
tara:strand:+ start:1037 stop:1504 length:468 start_codon:yes stop_codon:yes gene_type:complete